MSTKSVYTKLEEVCRSPHYEDGSDEAYGFSCGTYLAGEIFDHMIDGTASPTGAGLTIWYEGPMGDFRFEDKSEDIELKATPESLRAFSKVCLVAADFIEQKQREGLEKYNDELAADVERLEAENARLREQIARGL